MRGSLAHRVAAAAIGLALALAPADSRIALAGVTGTATNDAYGVNEDRVLTVAAPGVLSNDGPPSPALCVETGSENVTGLKGTLQLRKNGSFDFTPNENFNGSTSFTYRMGTSQTSIDNCPEGGQSNTATVTITVTAVNDPPFVSTDQCAVDITVAEDSGPFDSAPHCVQMQDFGPTDENSQHFSAWLVSNNNPDLFSVQPAITLVMEDIPYGRLTFTPAPNANGRARVTVRGRDDGGTANGGDDTSDPVRFFIDVTPVNDAPTSAADAFQALPGQTLVILAPGVLKNDADADGDALTAELVSNATQGSVSLSPNGAFTYTPNAGFVGVDAFSYRATDGTAMSPTRAVTITVSAVPTANPGATPSPGATAGPTSEPSPEPVETPDESALVPPSLEASTGPSGASLEPGATPDPSPVDEEGGLSIPALVVGLLFLSLLAFGGAVLIPRWLEARKAGGPPTGVDDQ